MPTTQPINQAFEAFQAKDYARALKLFDQTYKETKSLSILFNIGLCYYGLSQLEKAKKALVAVYENGRVQDPAYEKTIAYLHDIALKIGNEKEIEFWKGKLGKADEVVEGKTTSVDGDGALKTIAFFKTDITFKDVMGMENIKKYLTRHVVNALKYPDLYKKYNKHTGTGMIMYGGSGLGKTYISRACAGEAGAKMIIVKPQNLLSQYVSVGEKNVAKLWAFARKNAPVLMFLDEVDSITGKRHSNIGDTKGEGSALRMIISALLIEMSNVESSNEGIMIIAATNKPFDIDPALKRSGRFDDSIYISPPTLKERTAMFRYYLHNKPIDKINYTKLGLVTAGYSNADIARIVDISLLNPIDEAIKTNKQRNLNTADIIKTIRTELPESPLKEWFFSTKNEMLGYTNVEIIDGKKHKSFRGSGLDPGEATLYKPLIQDCIRFTSGFGLLKIQMERKMGYLLP